MTGARAERIVLRRSRRLPRAVVAVPLASLLILVLGWSVLWAVARWQADSAIDRFIAQEASHGRTWSCPERSISGFPFRIALDCPGVSFAGLVDGSPAEGRLAGLRAETFLYEPSSVDVTLAGPMTLTSRDGRDDFALDWSRFEATLRGLLGGLSRVEFAIEGATLKRPGSGPAHVDRIELHAGPATGRPAEDAAASVDIAVVGAAVPALDALTGEAAPLGGAFAGVVTRAYGDLPDFGTATVERWRLAGGRVEISDLKLGKGPLSASATGWLGLDDEHRLAGRLAASLAGFAPLAKRYGIPLEAVAVGNLLTRLVGRTAAPPPAAPGAIDLPITFADGDVTVGPVRIPRQLLRLY